jgi:catalase
MERMYAGARTLRQVHAKMHGCVKAEFIVEKDLPTGLRVGIFKEAKSFPAWVRFSNGVTQIQHDKKPDTRGCAIKLMGVPGEKLLDNEKNWLTQDLVLANSPFFFAKDLAGFTGLLKATVSKMYKLMVPLFLITHWRIAYRTVFKILIKCRHPFEISYFSGSPYQFGDETRAVKYHLRPSPANRLEYTDEKDFDYLRKSMAATLDKHAACFDFCIQFQTDAVAMPIEDATITWTSPFIKVATLRIPAQKFDTPERDLFGDDLTYNIWHSLPEHRPLGSFNRGRKFIYEELYKFRIERNGAELSEPVAGPDFLNPENLQ